MILLQTSSKSRKVSPNFFSVSRWILNDGDLPWICFVSFVKRKSFIISKTERDPAEILLHIDFFPSKQSTAEEKEGNVTWISFIFSAHKMCFAFDPGALLTLVSHHFFRSSPPHFSLVFLSTLSNLLWYNFPFLWCKLFFTIDLLSFIFFWEFFGIFFERRLSLLFSQYLISQKSFGFPLCVWSERKILTELESFYCANSKKNMEREKESK